MAATEVLKAVLRIERNWDSHSVDMIRRVYWTCNVVESYGNPTRGYLAALLTSTRWYYLDLNLPRSDASAFQEFIALPDFSDRSDFGEEPSIEKKYQYNFLSMISLRRLIHRSFEELHERKLPEIPPLPSSTMTPNQLTKSTAPQPTAATTTATKRTGPSSSPSSPGSWTSGARSSRTSCAGTTPRA